MRLNSYACSGGSTWSQTFSSGIFGDNTISATGGGATSFSPSWSQGSNQVSNWSYDADGNLKNNGSGTGTSTYTWDADGKMLSAQPSGSSEVCVTYDAFDRAVETATGSSCTSGATYQQFVYDPLGEKMGFMNGQTIGRVRVPLPGGGKAVFEAGGTLLYYWHADGMGNIRLFSNASTSGSPTFHGDTAYAPLRHRVCRQLNAGGGFSGTDGRHGEPAR